MTTKSTNGARSPRSLPERTLLVQLGAAVAMREAVVAATRPLARPGEVKTRVSQLGKRAGTGVARLEQRGERAGSELQSQMKRAMRQIRRTNS
jgi:hypothetical protein